MMRTRASETVPCPTPGATFAVMVICLCRDGVLDLSLRLPAADLRRLRHVDAQVARLVGDDLAPDAVHDLRLGFLSFLRIDQVDVDAGEVARRLLVAADREQRVLDALQVANRARDPLADETRRREARPLGRAHVHLELRSVVVGLEALGDGACQREARAERERAGDDDDPAVPHDPAKNGHVDALEGTVERVDGALEHRAAALLPVRRHRIEQAGGQHRREREADEQRDRDRERHRDAEALQEPPDDAVHERHWQEHGHERERRREDREPDVARRQDRGHEGLVALLLDEADDVLQHDDGVVDDDPDGEREGEQRDDVQREPGHPHRREGADDRDRDRERGDERAPDVAEEDQDDERGEGRAEDQVLADGAHARPNGGGVVADDLHLRTRA
jgi:hypothetical protein